MARFPLRPTPRASTAHPNGFTLMELLIALFIFALITSASSGLLNLAFNTDESTKTRSEAVAELAVARALIKADMAQLISRPTRGQFGTQRARGLVGGTANEDESVILRFARLGWHNPGGRLDRGSTQAVDYVLEAGQLIRRTPLRTDPAPDTVFRDRILFSGVSSAVMEFFISGTWQLSWQSGDITSTALPPAVRLTLEFDDGTDLTQLFLISGTRL